MMMIFAVTGKGEKKLAHRFEKGTHLYFPFKNGLTVQDSQCKPRYYLTKESLQNNLNESDYSEVVEYAPVVHGKWEECDWVEYDGHSECVHYPRKGLRCSRCCNVFKKELLWKANCCPNCGAKTDLED